MIRTSLRRLYSTAPKPTTKNAKSFPLARPTKPRPAATRPPPPKKPDLKKEPTILEAPYSPIKWLHLDGRVLWRAIKTAIPVKAFPRSFLICLNVFILWHVFQSHVYEVGGTLGASMLPTLYFEGDWVVVNKFYRRGKGVQVGDVVSAQDPLRPEGLVLKRVVGMPGDFVLADSVETTGRMIQV
jgi:hypothetical protein